jgi:hypothetical protein
LTQCTKLNKILTITPNSDRVGVCKNNWNFDSDSNEILQLQLSTPTRKPWSNPTQPLPQDTSCPEATANSFCLFSNLVGWGMDWKSADFHDGQVIFWGREKLPFLHFCNTFSYIELPKMFQISFLCSPHWKWVGI